MMCFTTLKSQEVSGIIFYNNEILKNSDLYIVHETKSVDKINNGKFIKIYENTETLDSLFINYVALCPMAIINLPTDRERINLDTIKMFIEYEFNDKIPYMSITDNFFIELGRRWHFIKSVIKDNRENRLLEKEFKRMISNEVYCWEGMEFRYKFKDRRIIIDLSNPK